MGYDESLEFVRHELESLVGARLLGNMAGADESRYGELCRKERALLAERKQLVLSGSGAR